MLPVDKENLKSILLNYNPKEVMREMSELAIEAAGEMSDEGLKSLSKQMTVFAASLEDLVRGRPYLV